ncbi:MULTISPECIES: hypothetical protein [Streptomyces]|uniref:hypothetical protein n=1 Tax=Streptomyces TaxID=1883 RepID=UPI001962571C|nr:MULTISPECIES: hypothetical protein [Streptomyces]QRX91344.1 hypothetical protein JNO44_11335 [Streptomyces noursei]UJB41120.1 hypothetical protein HRD51_10075 [Streptomyces sp. A1-5]
MTASTSDAPRWVRRGGRLVSVEPATTAGGRWALPGTGAPTLRMVLGTPGGAYVVEAVREGVYVVNAQGDGTAKTADERVDAGRPPCLHDHFAVDIDLCAEERWLGCADLLHGSVPRPRDHALRWVTDVLADRVGCRLATLPLDDGGWAVAERRGGRGQVRPCLVPAPSWCGSPPTAADRALLPSCLYGWAAAGQPWGKLASMVVLTRATYTV